MLTKLFWRSKFFWGSLENEVKKPGVSGYPMKVYLASKPSGKTDGFLNGNEKETAFLRLRLLQFFGSLIDWINDSSN